MSRCEHCRELINPCFGLGGSFWWLGPVAQPDYADCPPSPTGLHSPEITMEALNVAGL